MSWPLKGLVVRLESLFMLVYHSDHGILPHSSNTSLHGTMRRRCGPSLHRSGRSPLSFRVSSSSAFFRSSFWQAAVTSVVSCLSSHLSFSFGPWSKAETGAPASTAADTVRASTIFAMEGFPVVAHRDDVTGNRMRGLQPSLRFPGDSRDLPASRPERFGDRRKMEISAGF